jgi:heme A synthase
MATAAAGIITGVSAAAFFRKNKNWLKIHKTCNSWSLGGIAVGIIMAFLFVLSSGGKHMDGLHQITGLTVFIIAFITLFLGFYQFKAKNKSAARTAHRWLGRLSLLLLPAAIALGLRLVSII